MKTCSTLAKTTFCLSGTLIMMSGNFALGTSSFLSYSGVSEDSDWHKILGATSFLTMSYVLIFTRGINLWNYFSSTKKSTILTSSGENNSNKNKLDYFIVGVSLVGSLCYFFFSGFLGTRTSLKLAHTNSTVILFGVWIYVWFSLTLTYLTFSLPRSIKNVRGVADLFSAEKRGNVNISALKKMLITTIPGTLSFGALTHFLVKQAEKNMSFIKEAPSYAQTLISTSIALTCMLSFGSAKSLEAYQHFSSHQQIAEPLPRLLNFTHQGVGMTYLILIFLLYYYSSLDLFAHFGADIQWKTDNLPIFLLGLLFSASSTFIEYVFSYKNMFRESAKLFPAIPKVIDENSTLLQSPQPKL